jgi:hypothetical protein
MWMERAEETKRACFWRIFPQLNCSRIFHTLLRENGETVITNVIKVRLCVAESATERIKKI